MFTWSLRGKHPAMIYLGHAVSILRNLHTDFHSFWIVCIPSVVYGSSLLFHILPVTVILKGMKWNLYIVCLQFPDDY